MNSYVYLDGKVMPVGEAGISIDEIGLLRGDGSVGPVTKRLMELFYEYVDSYETSDV